MFAIGLKDEREFTVKMGGKGSTFQGEEEMLTESMSWEDSEEKTTWEDPNKGRQIVPQLKKSVCLNIYVKCYEMSCVYKT